MDLLKAYLQQFPKYYVNISACVSIFWYFRRFSTFGKYLGNESRIVTPAEIKDIHPHLATDILAGGVYVPGDGSVDPTG